MNAPFDVKYFSPSYGYVYISFQLFARLFPQYDAHESDVAFLHHTVHFRYALEELVQLIPRQSTN